MADLRVLQGSNILADAASMALVLPPAPSTQHEVLCLAKGSVPVCSKPSFGYLLVLSVVELKRSRGSVGRRWYDLLLMSVL